MTNTFDSIRYWNTQEQGFIYPEMDPTTGYAPIQGRANAGICISGGGSVSASLIAGYFAGLNQLKIMNNLRYISGVSGGTWGSAPYVYSGSAAFSGNPALPQDILTTSDITNTANGSMQQAVAAADIASKSIAYLAEAKLDGSPINRVYEKGVGACFLTPFGIPSPRETLMSGPDHAYFFSSTAEAVKDIQSRNPKVKNNFLTMADNMPYLIMNATMFVPVTQAGMDPANYICPFEITPLYSGIKAPQNTGNNAQDVGGFFVETFGFNTTLTSATNGVAKATGDYPFELCQPVGASGAALEGMLESDAPQLLGCFPQFNYWNPNNPSQGTVQYDFGDGGNIEDTGVTALLARGVQNIGVFLTEPVFFPGTDAVGCLGFTERVFGYNQIACLFGQPLIDDSASVANGQVEYITPASTHKQVFDSSGFQPLLTALLAARTGGNGMVASMTMNVVSNSLFGINVSGSYQPQVVWSVIDKAANWTSALNSEITEYMNNTADVLTDFPEVLVFFQNPDNVIELTPAQTNLLADFGYWMVMNNQATFTGVLTPVAAEAVEMA